MPVAKDGTITGLATQIYSWLALQKMVKLEGRTGMKFSSRGSALSIAKKRLQLPRGMPRAVVLDHIEVKIDELRWQDAIVEAGFGPGKPAWVPCEHCEGMRCNIHSTLTDTHHAADCECPPIEHWPVDPYGRETT
jgi:hypothetical protein